MKTTRKLLAMVLAVIMVMSLATTAFAADPTYTLTLNGAQAGHTYTAYQIFAGDLSGDTLSNIVWGSGVTADGQNALGVAADKAASLKNTEDAEAFAAEVAPYLTGGTASSAVANGTCTISGLEAGYYLVQTTGTTTENGVKTYYIMKVVADTSADIKAGVPKVEKSVDDTDVSIGDEVTFTLTATMPSNIQGYETYKVIFHDTLSAGLDFVEDSATVTVGGVDKTGAFDINENNGNLTVSCANVLTQGATTGSKIVVTYKAKLDSDAVIGTEGNLNTVKLEYSNDPNGEGTGKTPAAEVKVYTWSLKINKVDGNNAALAGAGFTLYDAQNNAVTLTRVNETNVYKVDPAGTTTEITTGNDGILVIEGLESADYTLKETTTPAGYNTAADTEVTIAGTTAPVTEVTVTNYAGTELPSTGGMGTTLFYIFGAILMLGAAVLLVTKKRMATAE